MPGRRRWTGAEHPVTRVVDEIVGIFRELGFAVATGPEVETEWFNFLALNFPADHPAMDMHDTLYLDAPPAAGEPGGRLLLRTHTSPVQIRVMQASPPPVRVVMPGMVYRNDAIDASHLPAFSQIEGLAVDEGITFVDLKATLNHFARRFFAPTTRTRFRPSFFPFTEPSAEMDVECQLCHGSGCPACKGTGWMEILGCGMVHEAVLENVNLDPERYTGWAFGMGPHRIALLRYGVPDIRLLLGGDMRFLEAVGRPGGGDA
jgi:phenylalanyl-tRNA synthetase alpha chain